MSFTSSGKRHSGGKGFSGGKKAKKKRQEFHGHKLRPSDQPGPDLEQLRGRVIIALGKLGQQRFATEPGGYGLKNWLRNFNLLLDEFDEKVGTAALPAEYLAKRRELTATLMNQVETSAVDAEIGKLAQEEAELSRRMNDEETRLNARLEALRSDLAKATAQISEEKKRKLEARTGQQKDAASPRPFFKRLLGRGPPRTPMHSSSSAETSLEALETRQELVRLEIAEVQRVRAQFNDRTLPDSPYAGDWRMLESLRGGIRDLEGTRTEMHQFTREREQVTGTLAALISQISFGDSAIQTDDPAERRTERV